MSSLQLMIEEASFYDIDLDHHPLSDITNRSVKHPRPQPFDDYTHPAWDLPLKLLRSYLNDKETTAYPSVNTLLDRLHLLRFDIHRCYKFIELMYGDSSTAHQQPWPSNREERRKPFAQQQHPRWLRANTPLYYVEILPRLYWAQEVVDREIQDVDAAVDDYVRNLKVLREAFRAKFARRLEVLDGDVDLLVQRMGEGVLEAFEALDEIVGPVTTTTMETNPKFLGDLREFWRTLGGREDRRPVERAWEWVAGRELVLD